MYRAQSNPLLLLDPTVSPPSNADTWLPSHHFSLLMHPGDLPMVLQSEDFTQLLEPGSLRTLPAADTGQMWDDW
jgi:hypothetical protein